MCGISGLMVLHFQLYLTPSIWEFPKIRGALSWGPYNKDPAI